MVIQIILFFHDTIWKNQIIFMTNIFPPTFYNFVFDSFPTVQCLVWRHSNYLYQTGLVVDKKIIVLHNSSYCTVAFQFKSGPLHSKDWVWLRYVRNDKRMTGLMENGSKKMPEKKLIKIKRCFNNCIGLLGMHFRFDKPYNELVI